MSTERTRAQHVLTLIVLLVTALLGMSLSGCSPAGSGTSGSADTSATAGPLTEVVTAVGSGKATVAPDRAVMTFSVTRRGSTARQALAAADDVARRIRRGVVAAKVPREDVRTADLSLYPQRNRSGRVTGYTASIMLEVTVRDIATLGDVVSGGTIAGANDFSGPRFSVSQENKANREALRDAVEDARARAEVMAKASGRSLGEVVVVTEAPLTEQPVLGGMYSYKAMRPNYSYGGFDVGVEPGRMDVTTQATVTFRLK